jgi:hypothetical protein
MRELILNMENYSDATLHRDQWRDLLIIIEMLVI